MQKHDERSVILVKRQRALCADYEFQKGNAITPAIRSLIARAVSIQMSLERIEAEQVAGKPIDVEKHAYLAGMFARLLARPGLTTRLEASAAPYRPVSIEVVRAHANATAQTLATKNGWSDTERDRFAEEEFQSCMDAA